MVPSNCTVTVDANCEYIDGSTTDPLEVVLDVFVEGVVDEYASANVAAQTISVGKRMVTSYANLTSGTLRESEAVVFRLP